MDDFLRRIESEQPARGFRGALPPAGFDLRGKQLSKHRERRSPVVEPLAGEPLIECRDPARVVLEKVSAIHIGSLAKRMNGSNGYERIESRRIDLDGRLTEADRLRFSG